ncbi:YajQ family cyclic di-GMP-binding protein [Geosporobacter ferrireducens]|uniref:Nucleotide-binding protein Gferi_23120 n=1 Tax=Geosporobacter ferrireducens TaxID=1424294 RepID=A0A1D8GMM7_9FIRM|nr:YajQ family cyclic di-GMP-binding protein [Geosporobacter ferrireducens]AOT72178.1 YajQ family cyclic di-GMP-binding protein [Geosporobacter ferrireducens]MTI56067.1 YajQ family cyclic di-GMP-binding protein [Geosporobacter ferrireducens]
MASNCSFDVVSEVNFQEVDNAVNQAKKELAQRYDFKGSKATIDLDKDEIKITAEDDFRIKNIVDILQTKLVKRNVPLKSLDYGKIEPAGGSMARQIITVQRGISKEKGKDIVAAIKNSKLKVQAQIMDDQVRVTGKDKDILQEVIQMLKSKDFGVELQFTNYRS